MTRSNAYYLLRRAARRLAERGFSDLWQGGIAAQSLLDAVEILRNTANSLPAKTAAEKYQEYLQSWNWMFEAPIKTIDDFTDVATPRGGE